MVASFLVSTVFLTMGLEHHFSKFLVTLDGKLVEIFSTTLVRLRLSTWFLRCASHLVLGASW